MPAVVVALALAVAVITRPPQASRLGFSIGSEQSWPQEMLSDCLLTRGDLVIPEAPAGGRARGPVSHRGDFPVLSPGSCEGLGAPQTQLFYLFLKVAVKYRRT